MKLLIYSLNYSPEKTGIGKYSGEMAVWFAARGHEVRVVASPPHYPAWQVLQPYNSWWYRFELVDGIKVWRAPLWIPLKPTGVKRVIHLLSFAVSSAPVMFRQILWRPEAVFVVAPAMVCAPVALATSKLAGAASWLHVQDFEVEVAFNQGQLKGQTLQRWVKNVEAWFFRRFDRVSTISNRMMERAVSKSTPRRNVVFFPNWADIEGIRPLPDKGLNYRLQLDIEPDAVVALFAGTLGRKQGLSILPAAARILSADENIVFVICGDGVMKSEIEQACEGLKNVRQLPLQPIERLGELLSVADIHLLPQSPEASDLVMPSKLSGMLASGRPVIATCEPDTEIAMVLRDCGLVVQPDDPVALAAAVAELAGDAARRGALGQRARAHSELKLGKESVLRDLEKALLGAINKQTSDSGSS